MTRIGLNLAGVLCFACIAASACAQDTAASHADRAVRPVPLWRIPLSELDGMEKKPLFSPSRRPRVIVQAEPPPPVVQPPRETQPPVATLVGVLMGPGDVSVAILSSPGRTKTDHLRIGDRLQDWTVTAITKSQIFLGAEGRTTTLALQRKSRTPPLRAANNPTPNQYGD